MSLADMAPSFACPSVDDPGGAAFCTVARARGAVIGGRIVKALRSDEVGDAVREHAGASAWTPEVGLALSALLDGKADLAALQFLLGASGPKSRWDAVVKVDQPLTLYCSGTLLAVAERISAGCGDGAIEIRSGPNRWTLAWRDDGWDLAGGGPPAWPSGLPSGSSRPAVVSTGLLNEPDALPWPATVGRLDADRQAQDLAEVGAALSLLRESGLLYEGWVRRAVSAIMLVQPRTPGAYESGSAINLPGLVAMTRSSDPVRFAEVLVHEASHQHLMALSALTPLVEGDEEFVFSPIRNEQRPLGRALLGAHAVGNMIAYYDTLASQGRVARDNPRRLRFRQWFADDYGPALEASQSLSPAGRAVWRSLNETIGRLD